MSATQRMTVFVVAVIASLLITLTARTAAFSIKQLEDPHVGGSTRELHAQMRHSAQVIRFFTGRHSWMRWSRHASCLWLRGRHVERVCTIARNQLRAHRWLYGVAHDRLVASQRPSEPVSSGSAGSWLVSAFLCIHSHEGAWNANTGNGYYGGLQFGWSEWQTYGGRYASRADLASPGQQIAAAISYYHDAGFAPWPNTARMCGLL